MQAEKLLHKLLKDASAVRHKKRLNSLLRAVSSVVHQGKLSLTSIGRHLRGSAKVKHKIKSIDQLLGNAQLGHERQSIYATLSRMLCKNLKEILVLIDWSACESHKNCMLKASLVLPGRSMTLYEEVHAEKYLGNFTVHQRFLNRLKTILPKNIHVIIETDAGFRTEWFELVRNHGWDFIGRIRSNMQFRYKESFQWFPCLSLLKQAKASIQYLGEVVLSKKRSLEAHLYLSAVKKRLPAKLVSRRRRILSGKMEASYQRGYKEPWLLVTSLSGGQKISQQIMSRYRCRMRIEHEFRNTKNAQWGIGLEYSRTKDVRRLEILLLIGYLAVFILWFHGLAAEHKQLHRSYQSNSIRHRRVLSLVYLGLQILLHEPTKIKVRDITQAFKTLYKLC